MVIAGWEALGVAGGLALFAAMIFAATAGYARYRHDMAASRARVGVGSELACTPVGTIEYAIEGNGTPALVIHGAGGGYDQGLRIARENLGDGFRIVAPSRFGYLRTPLPNDGSPAAQANAHAALLDHLRLERAVVLGFSAGALSAIELALRHPSRVSALILESPITYEPRHRPRLDPSRSSRIVLHAISGGADLAYWLALHVARGVVVRFCGVLPELDARASEPDRVRVTDVIRGMLPLSSRIAGVRNDSTTAVMPWPLDKIAVPTLVIAAADDLFNTLPAARFTAAHIRGARLVVIDSGGHLLVGRHHEARMKVAEFLADAGMAPLVPDPSSDAHSTGFSFA